MGISKILEMFQRLQREDLEQADVLQAFKEWMSSGGVPMKLQTKVRRYLEFQFKTRKEGNSNFKQEYLFEYLSPWLRKELQVVQYKKVLGQHPCFEDLSNDIMGHVCHLAVEELWAPGEQFAQTGQVVREACFVIRGKLKITAEKRQKPYASRRVKSVSPFNQNPDASLANKFQADGIILSAPGYVGGKCLLTDKATSKYTVTSASHAKVLKIASHEIQKLRQEFPPFNAHIQKYAHSASSDSRDMRHLDCSLHIDLDNLLNQLGTNDTPDSSKQ